MLRGKTSTYYPIILFETKEFKMAAVSIGKRVYSGLFKKREPATSRSVQKVAMIKVLNLLS